MNETENHYCETCDSCGETGCCPPINCHAVKCKYGNVNLKNYKSLLDQWSVMLEALEAVTSQAYAQFKCGDKHATFNRQTIDTLKVAIAKVKGETK